MRLAAARATRGRQHINVRSSSWFIIHAAWRRSERSGKRSRIAVAVVSIRRRSGGALLHVLLSTASFLAQVSIESNERGGASSSVCGRPTPLRSMAAIELDGGNKAMI